MRTIYFFSLILILGLGGPIEAAAPPASSGMGVVGKTGPKVDQAEISAPSVKEMRKGTRLLTRAVGEVGEHVVTSREVQINDAIERGLSGKTPSTHKILSDDSKTFPAEVGKVLDEWVVYLEARSLSSQPSAHLDIASAVKTVQNTWSTHAAWQALQVSSEELRDAVERKLIAKEFERLKSDPQLAPVTDEDALVYYRKNRLKFGSLPFSTFKDNIKKFLIQQQTERRLTEWREVLRRKYKVRNFIAG